MDLAELVKAQETEIERLRKLCHKTATEYLLERKEVARLKVEIERLKEANGHWHTRVEELKNENKGH